MNQANEHMTNIKEAVLADKLLMIAPQYFHVNSDTLSTNSFQQHKEAPHNLHAMACREFEGFVESLLKNHVDVLVFEGESDCVSPDRIYPNNWISFHENCNILYPMQPANRRTERLQPVLDVLPENCRSRELINWSNHESEGRFLEGTGSLVLDRRNKVAFAAISPRTHEALVLQWCELMNYSAIMFVANSPGMSVPVYHTNVVMSVLHSHLFVSLASITQLSARTQIQQYAERFNKVLVELSPIQLGEFAANILEFQDTRGSACIAISERAIASLSASQLRVLEQEGNIISADLTCIERFGGGSARCMLAEVF